MQKWYYQLNGHSTGPVETVELKRQIVSGRINGRTLVWHDALPDWIELADSELAELLIAPLNEECIAACIGRFNRVYQAFWILVAITAVVTLIGWSFIAALLMNYQAHERLSDGWLAAAISVNSAALLVGMAAVVLWCIMLYESWRTLPPECAETTPGKAVGFLFIPFFNWYWNFVAVATLGKALNAQIVRDEIKAPLLHEGILRSYCILRALDLLIVPLLLSAIVGCLAPRQWRKGVLAILQNRLRQHMADSRNAARNQKMIQGEK